MGLLRLLRAERSPEASHELILVDQSYPERQAVLLRGSKKACRSLRDSLSSELPPSQRLRIRPVA